MSAYGGVTTAPVGFESLAPASTETTGFNFQVIQARHVVRFPDLDQHPAGTSTLTHRVPAGGSFRESS